MEYIKNDDLEAIGSIIEEFEGDTILGKHMFKAVKAYFRQKEKETRFIYTSTEKVSKTIDSGNYDDYRYKKMLKEADKVLHENYLKLSKKGNKDVSSKSKKKANS
jgi:chromosomal replication initiation ATPase DnaA